uniref:Uncharacterized protein n=1 Tax=Aureoumbra lagunensis TaxID=44058 RepID=A0A7S3NJK8_9STRA|mmetsp:Transcript_2762/g.3805  ORF Transcript_2762/g.3805 Transcript_2762/m.3805 type:complete len:217 (-) Transcript_2762:90-740(-)
MENTKSTRRPCHITLMPELWRSAIKYLSSSDMLIFKQTSRFGLKITTGDRLEKYFGVDKIALVWKKNPSIFYRNAGYYIRLHQTLLQKGLHDSNLCFIICFGVRLSQQDETADGLDKLLVNLRSNFPDADDFKIAIAAAKFMCSSAFVRLLALRVDLAMEYIDGAITELPKLKPSERLTPEDIAKYAGDPVFVVEFANYYGINLGIKLPYFDIKFD